MLFFVSLMRWPREAWGYKNQRYQEYYNVGGEALYTFDITQYWKATFTHLELCRRCLDHLQTLVPQK